MIDINDKINKIISDATPLFIKTKLNSRVLNIATLVSSVFIFLFIISGEYLIAGSFSLFSLFTSILSISVSKIDSEYLESTVVNLIKFLVISLSLLTVILNIELHKIPQFLFIYLIFVSSLSFVSRLYIIAFVSNNDEKSSPSALIDSVLAISLLLSIMPFLHNSVVIIYIIFSSVICNYYIVSDVVNIRKKIKNKKECEKENCNEIKEDMKDEK